MFLTIWKVVEDTKSLRLKSKIELFENERAKYFELKPNNLIEIHSHDLVGIFQVLKFSDSRMPRTGMAYIETDDSEAFTYDLSNVDDFEVKENYELKNIQSKTIKKRKYDIQLYYVSENVNSTPKPCQGCGMCAIVHF